MKKTLSVILAVLMLSLSLLSCSGEASPATTTAALTTKAASADPTPTPSVSSVAAYEYLLAQSNKAFDGVMDYFWHKSAKHFKKYTTTMVWEPGVALFALETLYNATGDEALKDYFSTQMAYMEKTIGAERLVEVSGQTPNIANDDSGWNAMTMMSIYRMTGYEKALDYARDIIRNSYNYYKDGDISNGIWYRLDDKYNPEHIGINQKCITCAALILAALDYSLETKGTDRYDEQLYKDTLALYNWVEEKLLRNGEKNYGGGKISYSSDYLYYMTLLYDPATKLEYPDGIGREDHVNEASSISSLFGNMAMAVIHKKLYDITGDDAYLERAVRTANALANSKLYTGGGIFLNDRDAWCNTSFAGRFVSEVMSIEATSTKLPRLFLNTAKAIIKECRTSEGLYSGSWSGDGIWDAYAKPEEIMTSSTTVHVIYAATLCAKLGYITDDMMK